MLRHALRQQPSSRLIVQWALRSLSTSAAVERILLTPNNRNGSTCRCSRRSQSTLASHAATAAPSKNRSAVVGSAATTGSAAPVVKPSVRQFRPHVNGQAVAFHMKDLLQSSNNNHRNGHSPLRNETAALREDSSPFPATKKREYESDLVVVLDMDECLIHSQFLSSSAAAQVYAHQLQQHRQYQNGNNNKAVVDHFRVTLPDGDLVHVNMRPGLQDFLAKVATRYETHVFTAAMDVYAKPVLDRLDPTGTYFDGRFYREHCRYDAARHAYVKDLDRLPLPQLGRTVLVDNNPLSFLTHPSNGILVSSFYNDPTDQTLDAVWKLLQELEDHQDVRPVLEDRFGLNEALTKQDEESNGNIEQRRAAAV